MSLPPRVFFTLFEVAARWGCAPTDVVEWAALERLQLMIGVPLVQAGGTPIAGLVELHAADLMTMFRRDGSGPDYAKAFRIKPLAHNEFLFITEPSQGLPIAKADLIISAAEVARFEEENEMVRKPSIGKATSPYDWDAMYLAVINRIYHQGLPETQAAFIGEFQEWFAHRDAQGRAPDERTIRRRLNPIWRTLREDA